MRDEKEGRKKQARSNKQGQTNNKAKQHSTPKAVTFPKKNELPRVGLKATTITCTCVYTYMHIGLLRVKMELPDTMRSSTD